MIFSLALSLFISSFNSFIALSIVSILYCLHKESNGLSSNEFKYLLLSIKRFIDHNILNNINTKKLK